MPLTRTLLLMRKRLWVIYLAIAIVFVQGGHLHVHVYDHEPLSSSHVHQQQAHFHHEAALVEHPGDIAEIELSIQGFLKTFSQGSLVIALFALVILTFSFHPLRQLPWPPDPHGLRTALRLGLRPPLRAPPL